MIDINALKYRNNNHFYFNFSKFVYSNNLKHKSKFNIFHAKSRFSTLNKLKIKFKRTKHINFNHDMR